MSKKSNMFDVRLDIALVIPNTITISRGHMLTNKFRMVLFKKKILYKIIRYD
jgi:hypothetical protein